MTSRNSKAKKFQFQGFVNLEFTEEEKAAITDWMVAFGEAPVDAAVVLVEAGWKVGMGWDDYHSTNQVSVTCKDPGSKYCGYCFTFKHDDLGKGLLVLRYVYDAQLKEGLYRLDMKKQGYDW